MFSNGRTMIDFSMGVPAVTLFSNLSSSVFGLITT
jgi:hypothetical protein